MKKQTIHNSDLYGFIPPQAVDVEEILLGAMLSDSTTMDMETVSELTTECFYKDHHQKIFKSILDIRLMSHYYDFALVCDYMRQNGSLDQIGGPVTLLAIMNKVASNSGSSHHAKILIDRKNERKCINLAQNIIQLHRDNDLKVDKVLDLFDELKKDYENIIDNRPVSLKDYGPSYLNEINTKLDKNKLLKTNIDEVNEIIDGFMPGQIAIIAARPSAGKTSFAMKQIKTWAEKGAKGLFFSLETTKFSLMNKLVCIEDDRFNLKRLKNHEIEGVELELSAAVNKLMKLPIYLTDISILNSRSLNKTVKYFKKKHSINYIVLDYIQLMDGEGSNDNEKMAEVSKNLKRIAKDYDLPVIALSQLSRDCEKEKRKPTMADLRNSGQIEQDADIIMFLYRPDRYNEDKKISHEIIVSVAKNKDGSISDTKIYANHTFTDFDSHWKWDNSTQYNPIQPYNPNQQIEPNKSFDKPIEDLPF